MDYRKWIKYFEKLRKEPRAAFLQCLNVKYRQVPLFRSFLWQILAKTHFWKIKNLIAFYWLLVDITSRDVHRQGEFRHRAKNFSAHLNITLEFLHNPSTERMHLPNLFLSIKAFFQKKLYRYQKMADTENGHGVGRVGRVGPTFLKCVRDLEQGRSWDRG
jgi:hypothetical protein